MPSVNISTFYPDARYTWSGNATLLNGFNTLAVYNTNTGTPSNGGTCCLWTVPANATWATFEVWGGGGGGAGACCCQGQVWGGGSGSYARRTISVVPGNTYRICAGGSTGCSVTCYGCDGFPSYVQTETASNAINLCAQGGGHGISNCAAGYGSCNWTSCICGSYCGQDFGICGHQAGQNNSTCGYQSYSFVANPTYIAQGVGRSMDYCQIFHGNQMQGCSVFPGGGSGTANTVSGSCCWGGWGQGGLVLVTYK